MGANASHETIGPDGVRNCGAANNGGKPHSTGSVFNPYGRASLRKSFRRRRSKRKRKEKQNSTSSPGVSQVDGQSEAHLRRMDKIKKTLRDSFRKKREGSIPEASKPHLWHSDESAVRDGNCSFYVKYLGCVEVYESRGMQVCEEALKVLRGSRRRPVRGILYVSGDGLRVVDDETKGLIVDQTIEKVSFCAPDRNHERGFSYICRDGTTRRWMCHGFIAIKDTGERLSHAVGCAFAACLERKQKRDKECSVTMTFDRDTSTFTRMGSFRQMTVTERLSDPQECKPIIDPVPLKKVDNPHAIARPHATAQLLQRQGSFRVFNQLNQSSPFKRQLSLRISDLPSNIERTRSMSLDNAAASTLDKTFDCNKINNNITVAPIPETSTLEDTPPIPTTKSDAVSAMCQQVSAGLSLLSNFPDELSCPPLTESPDEDLLLSPSQNPPQPSTRCPPSLFGTSAANVSSENKSKAEEWLAQINSQTCISNTVSSNRRYPHLSQLRSSSLGSQPCTSYSTAPSASTVSSTSSSTFSRRPPTVSNFTSLTTNGGGNCPPPPPNNLQPARQASSSSSGGVDPFDAEWVTINSNAPSNPNNPFLQSNVTTAFQVQM